MEPNSQFFRRFSLIFADFRFSWELQHLGNRRKPQESADFRRNPFVPFSLSLLFPPNFMCLEPPRLVERRQKGGFVKGWFWRCVPSFRFSFRENMQTYPRSGFRSGGTSECTLVLVFVPGKHPPKPTFCKNHPFVNPRTRTTHTIGTTGLFWN